MKTGLMIFFITLSISFAIAYVSVAAKLEKVNFAFIQLYLSNQTLESYVKKHNLNIEDSAEQIHKENFIKFLSESREWAFDYIETAQAVVREVADYLDNQDNDFDKAYETIQNAIANDERTKRLESIKQAKNKIMNELQIFPAIEKAIKST